MIFIKTINYVKNTKLKLLILKMLNNKIQILMIYKNKILKLQLLKIIN